MWICSNNVQTDKTTAILGLITEKNKEQVKQCFHVVGLLFQAKFQAKFHPDRLYRPNYYIHANLINVGIIWIHIGWKGVIPALR